MGQDFSIANLSIKRGDQIILQDFSFNLLPGTLLHLRGNNGVGKSTFLKVVAGLLPSDAGQVKLSGACSDLLYFYDAPIDHEEWQVRDALSFYAAIDKAPMTESVFTSLLTVLSLESCVNAQIKTLSLGQRKRLYLSRLFLKKDAGLWLLDEPLSGLDAKGMGFFQKQLKFFLQRGGRAIVTGHGLDYDCGALYLDFPLKKAA